MPHTARYSEIREEKAEGNIPVPAREYSVSFIKKNNRRANILDIIKIKKKVTIKDISSLIKDCSEKTIQRELVALLKEGVLRKEGERRWSTYSLPSPL